MEIKILSESKMPLLGRKTVSLSVTALKQPTPSKAELSKEIASKLKVEESILSIKRVSQDFGSNNCKVLVNVYSSPEELKKYEVYNKKPKKKAAEGQ